MEVFRKHKNVPIAVVGDLHGEWKILQDKIKAYQMEDAIIFQAGDFGVGFGYNDPREQKKENKRLVLLNSFFKKRNIFLYIISGNHDNPLFFDGNHNFSNIVFLQDYDIVEVGDKKILGIGGATSVDRKSNPNFPDMRGHPYPGRKKNVNWWSEIEKVYYDDNKLNSMIGIDVVLAHGCPDFAHPPLMSEYIKKWIEYDPELEFELIEERQIHTKIFNKLIEKGNNIQYYIYGHYHDHHMETIGTTKFWMLEIESFNELRF